MIFQWLKYIFLKGCAAVFWPAVLGGTVYALNEWSWFRWAFLVLAGGFLLFVWGMCSYNAFVERKEIDADRATRQGRKDYRAGFSFNDNPYPYSFPAERAAWDEGWFLAERENMKCVK